MSQIDALNSIIQSRRTHKKYSGEAIPQDTLNKIVANGPWAPMHRLGNPWRFAICDQAALEGLAQFLENKPNIASWPEPGKEHKLAKICAYLRNLGAMIYVTSTSLQADELRRLEDRDACAAAVQNMLLSAEAHGLASFWNSSACLRHPDTMDYLGADPHTEEFVAAIWLGGKTHEPNAPARRPLEKVTRIIGEKGYQA